ncbi:MAG TPA: type III pantothenate kinase, partial [Opitutales bacterium]|nr:type III pantothenate kinase [Opitutales bacterium]
MSILCIDIGNSFAHVGLVKNGVVLERTDIATPLLASGDTDAAAPVLALAAKARGAAWCSVVPKANAALLSILAGAFAANRVLNLNAATLRGLAIVYPHPSELGQDRLANAIGATKFCGSPVVSACLGTASVIDAVSLRGYEGGAIAPGLSAFSDYLHEKTAQLPKIDVTDIATPSPIGRSTHEAITNGILYGYAGMVAALVESVRAELARESGKPVSVVVTGGGARAIPEGFIPNARHIA